MMSSKNLEALIGAGTVAVALVLFLSTYSQTESGMKGGYELTAGFSSADGLQIGSDVRLSGIKVGTVVGLEVDYETYEAVVRMSVGSGLSLRGNTEAIITSAGLLGESYVALKPGAPGEVLEPGGRISRTKGPVNLLSAISQLVFSAGDSNNANAKD